MQDINNLNLNAAVQDNIINQTANLNSPIDNLTTHDFQDISSIDYLTNAQGQRLVQCSDGSFLSSVSAPNVRNYTRTSDYALAEGCDSDG